jgi:hypothetical protein
MARRQTKSPTRNDRVSAVSPALIEDIRQIIGEARRSVATTVNAGLTLLYWRIGKRIVDEVLGKERAAYGQQIVVSVARQLVRVGPILGETLQLRWLVRLLLETGIFSESVGACCKICNALDEHIGPLSITELAENAGGLNRSMQHHLM